MLSVFLTASKLSEYWKKIETNQTKTKIHLINRKDEREANNI